MTGRTISLEFEGYWTEENKTSVPSSSGIYCVYTCEHNKINRKVTLKKLIYIGESSNVESRITNHNKLEYWKRQLGRGETLCYAVAKVTTGESDRLRAEAALIRTCRPSVNTEHKGDGPFAYNKTTVTTSGTNHSLPSSVTVA
ncbi:GIY-YIG nuclease family protein [Xenorhabdus bovienii]|uniref:GIY-YIG nuclease family protein n=1 Tax=Xenorhabdus bovienii TaxID=40576 RepID=UPI00237CFF30|nr:GIY-YIG nuclease family protein [Xenorhabdus bovienii]MDE1495106.1 GIY-YIG nuclease family protein [Xenorhabdus bovienii]MDE9473157.1 GIY-YIG nuclease family protein [Xenorhabdus bovienii]